MFVAWRFESGIRLDQVVVITFRHLRHLKFFGPPALTSGFTKWETILKSEISSSTHDRSDFRESQPAKAILNRALVNCKGLQSIVLSNMGVMDDYMIQNAVVEAMVSRCANTLRVLLLSGFKQFDKSFRILPKI